MYCVDYTTDEQCRNNKMSKILLLAFEMSIKVHNEIPINENLAVSIELRNLDDRINFAQGSANANTQIERGNMMSTVQYSFAAK